MSTKTTNNYQQGVKIVQEEVKSIKAEPQTRNTGTTWFVAGTRIAKLVAVKDQTLINLEVNIPIQYEAINYEHITPQTAYAKHLGTMCGRLKTRDLEELRKVVKLIAEAWKQGKRPIPGIKG
jgi:cobalamin biosynthesis protein CobD/CbiB